MCQVRCGWDPYGTEVVITACLLGPTLRWKFQAATTRATLGSIEGKVTKQQLACKKGGKKSTYGGEDSEVVQLINTFCTEIQQLVLTIFMIAHFYHGLWAFGISGFWTERPCPIQFGSADCDHAWVTYREWSGCESVHMVCTCAYREWCCRFSFENLEACFTWPKSAHPQSLLQHSAITLSLCQIQFSPT